MSSLSAAILVEARTRAGLTQRALADRAGTSPSAIASIETGRRDPSLTTLNRLVEACGKQLRLHTEDISAADKLQMEWDAKVGPERARVNAARARSEIRSVRPLAEVRSPLQVSISRTW